MRGDDGAGVLHPVSHGGRGHRKRIAAHRRSTARSCASTGILAMGLRARSVIALGGVPGGSALICAWMSGWSLSSAKMDPTRIAETPALAAMAARLFMTPVLSSTCQASA